MLWLPKALTFVLAPLPNALFSHCGGDDFTTDYEGSGPIDLGRFITATIVVTGFALPLVLAHSEIIRPAACAMSIVGGSYVAVPLSARRVYLTYSTTGSCTEPSKRIAPHSSRKNRTTTKHVLAARQSMYVSLIGCALMYTVYHPRCLWLPCPLIECVGYSSSVGMRVGTQRRVQGMQKDAFRCPIYKASPWGNLAGSGCSDQS